MPIILNCIKMYNDEQLVLADILCNTLEGMKTMGSIMDSAKIDKSIEAVKAFVRTDWEDTPQYANSAQTYLRERMRERILELAIDEQPTADLVRAYRVANDCLFEIILRHSFKFHKTTVATDFPDRLKELNYYEVRRYFQKSMRNA